MAGSKQGRRKRVTDDDLALIWEQYQSGGYGAVAKGTGFSESYVRALVKRARLQHEAPPTPKRKGKRPGATALTKAIGRFIEDCQEHSMNGKHYGVALGALQGFPSHTTDPKIVEKAIGVLSGKLAAPMTVIQEIKLRQRLMDLAAGMERLSYEPAEDADRALFMAWGAEWATEHGISYGAFREMGVPAEALREAGITR